MAQTLSVFVTRTVDNCAVARDGVPIAATVYSEPFHCRKGDSFAFQVEWTDAPTGDLQLFWSDKPSPVMTTDADWNQDLGFGTAGSYALGGAPGKYADHIGNAKSRWYHFKVATGGGTGEVLGWVTIS